ncbi:MAG TPA: murein biosynthesis integral membrane protein MurJ [Symbiobacteriaceae bacterium]|nr:murein biosynthesis integral membrane protein MurJ [Symbiobacteriaceae bacterium]
MADVPRKRFFAAAGLVAALSILSRLLGYVREALLASRFGASAVTDSFLVAQEIPASIYFVISASLVLAFIPVYRSMVQKRGEAEAWRLFNSVLNVTGLLSVVLLVVGWVLAPFYMPLLVPGFPAEAVTLVVKLTRTMLPLLLIMGMNGLAGAVLNARERFGAPALVGFLSNLIVVAALFLVKKPDQILWVAVAVVLGGLLGMLVQVALLPRLGYRYQVRIDWQDPMLGLVGRLIVPVVIATSVQQVQTFATRLVASGLAEGTISALNYANRIAALPYGVIGVAVTTVIFPTLAEQGAGERLAELRETIGRGMRILAFLLVPMAVGTFLFGEPLIRLVFERGAFTAEDTQVTGLALQYYCLGILFVGWVDLFNRTLYAVQDSTGPMFAAILTVGLNVLGNWLLVGPLGHGGLALSASLSYLVGVVLLLWRVQRRLGALPLWEVLRSVAGSLAGSLVGGLVGWGLLAGGTAVLGHGRLVQAALVLGGLVLVLVCHVGLALGLKTAEGIWLRDWLGARLRRR